MNISKVINIVNRVSNSKIHLIYAKFYSYLQNMTNPVTLVFNISKQ